MSRHLLAVILPLFVVPLLVLGCSSDTDDSGSDGLRVVVTTPLLAEFAGRVAGDDASVTSLIPLGVDPHSWQPSTAVARDIAEADLLVVNGYRLEESLLDIVTENARDGVPIVVAAEGIEALDGGHDHADDEHADDEHADDGAAEGDPHLWMSVPNAIHYVENIRDALLAADADHAAGYEERAAAFIAELTDLDAEIRAALTSIPEERRTIVAFHDAYQYLAHEYGLEVVASVAPANPNQATSAQAIAEIVELVRTLGVPAVFKEPEFSAQSLDFIAQESGARVLELQSVLSEAAPTYAVMMRANVAALVDGLGG